MRFFPRAAALAVVFLVLAPAAAQSGAKPTGGTWIESRYDFAFATLTSLDVTGDVDIRRLTLDGGRYDADGLRDAYRAVKATGGDAAAAAFVADVEGALASEFKANLQAAFPGSAVAEPEAVLDEASLGAASSGEPTDPPVAMTLASHVDVTLAAFGFEGFDEDDVQTLLDAGASVDLPLVFFADPGHTNAFKVTFPAGTRVSRADGEALSGPLAVTVDGRSAASAITESTTARISSATAENLLATVGTIDVVVDITDLDVTLAGAAGGDFGRMIIDVTGTVELQNVVIPDSSADAFPPGVHFRAISSNGIREVVASGLVGPEELDRIGADFVATLRERLETGLGATPDEVEGAFVAGSLQTAPGEPVVFKVHATVARPLAGGAQPAGAAIALYSVTQSLPFQRIEGLDTVYRLVLPRGIAATSASSDGGDVTTTHRGDGRDEVQLALVGDDAPDEATMDVQIAVTPSFVLAKFWPVVVLALLVVAGVVGLAAWGLVRAFRK